MTFSKKELDTLYDNLGVRETVKSDQILRWDGSKLYVKDDLYRADHKTGSRKRDVTAEVARTVSKQLKAKS